MWNGNKHACQGGRQKERRWDSERKWQKPEAKQNDRKGASSTRGMKWKERAEGQGAKGHTGLLTCFCLHR